MPPKKVNTKKSTVAATKKATAVSKAAPKKVSKT